MKTRENCWENKKILILGAGRQGQAAARFMLARHASVTVTDSAPAEKLQPVLDEFADEPIHWVLGVHPFSLLDGLDFIIVSGGADLRQPLLTEAVNRGIPLVNDTEIFMQEAVTPIIAITGSAGKTTTTTLVGQIARAGQERLRPNSEVYVGGNIGNPLLPLVDKIQPNDTVILELSSFQLDLTTHSPHIAAVLNITPNHLDRHGTMAAYIRAKANILRFQKARDWAVLNRDDPNSDALRSSVRGSLVTYGFAPVSEDGASCEKIAVGADETTIYAVIGGQRTEILRFNEVSLPGRHNLSNVMAAAAITLCAGFDVEAIRAGVIGFTGVPHRLETVGIIGGVRYINDSIATAPERTLAAVEALSNESLILLLGGRDKKLPWGKLAEVLHAKAKAVITFGEDGSMIADVVESSSANAGVLTIRRATTMLDALEKSKLIAAEGDVVVLSPGGTSYDAFKDFEERGEQFRQWVNSQPLAS